MPTTDGFYPDMSDYPRHECVCRICGEPLPVMCCAEMQADTCDECEETNPEAHEEM